MSKRVQTKDLYQRMGRPEFTPQAKASTFAYVAPQTNKNLNTLLQFAEAGNLLSGATSKWGKVMMAEEESEGLKEGQRLALISYRENGMKAFRAAELQGIIDNADNPFVKKGLLFTMGQLAANSEAFQNHLLKGAVAEIRDRIPTDDTAESFDAWADRFLFDRVDEFMEGMPNSQWMRDQGFSEAATTVVERAKQHFRSVYKNEISTQNVNAIQETIHQGFLRNSLQQTYDWFNGKVPPSEATSIERSSGGLTWSAVYGGPDESKEFPEHGRLASILGVAPRSTLPATGPNSNQRLFWHNQAAAFINGSVVESPNSLKYAESLRTGLRMWSRFENLTELNTGALARSGSTNELYDTFRLTLEKRLVQAAAGENRRAAAAEEATDAYISMIALATQMQTPKSTMTFPQEGVPKGTELEYTKTIEDFGGRTLEWMQYIMEGNGMVGDKKIIWGASDEEFLKDGVTKNPAFGNPLSPTRAVMDALEGRGALQFLQDDINAINTQTANRIKNYDRLKDEGEEAWANGVLRFKKSARFHFKGGEKWNDEVLNKYVNNNMAELTNISREWNIHGGGAPVLDNLRTFMNLNFGDSESPTPRKGLVDGFAFIADPKNTLKWANKPAMQRIAEFIKDGHTLEDAKLLSDTLSAHAAPILSLLKFDKGETGEVLMNRMLTETLQDNNSTLMESIRKQNVGVPKGALQFGGAMYSDLHQEMQNFMRAEYYPLIHKLSQIYNMNTKHDTFQQSLEAALMQAGSGPVTITHPTTGAPVQLLPHSLRHSFKLMGHQPNFYVGAGGAKHTFRSISPISSPLAATYSLYPTHRAVISYTVGGPTGKGGTIYGSFKGWDGKLKAREQGQ